MTRIDAVRQLQFLRQDALAKAHPQSRLAIQEYPDAGTAAESNVYSRDTALGCEVIKILVGEVFENCENREEVE